LLDFRLINATQSFNDLRLESSALAHEHQTMQYRAECSQTLKQSAKPGLGSANVVLPQPLVMLLDYMRFFHAALHAL
jgi:hypothetical protein